MSTVFDLPARLADPGLVADDERHLSAVATALAAARTDVARRLEITRGSEGGTGQAALDRDQEIHRLTARLRSLHRFGADLCLGRTRDAAGATTYIGRTGLRDIEGRRLLVDWRSSAAEPFFAATRADPRGLVSRRRYRWTDGHVTGVTDEVLAEAGDRAYDEMAALDATSAFVASLGAARSSRMRDVLTTIQADQDAAIRAHPRGALVVDGGPGTGKTVVALHRVAWLLHADPRLREGRGGVLVVGPHREHLAYVSDVLPDLGEDGVATCLLADLVAEGGSAVPERDPEIARVKAGLAMVEAIEPAVAFHEEPPDTGADVETPWGDVWLSPADWSEAFAAPDPGTPHNEARDQVWDALVEILADKVEDPEATPEVLEPHLHRHAGLLDAIGGSWPRIAASELVADLWTVPAYLRHCAPWLTDREVGLLRRTDGTAWTTADLPLLDAAHHRLGDPGASRRRRRHEIAVAHELQRRGDVVDDLLAAGLDDEYGAGLVSMLRGQDGRHDLVDRDALTTYEPTDLAGPYAHVVVDEAQELTDAQWQMILRRCPSRSLTLVGDRAQARDGFGESWRERLARVGLERVEVATLTTNYRTPVEVMAEAEPMIRLAVPDAVVPTSVRRTGIPVEHRSRDDLSPVVGEWSSTEPEGTACVIAAGEPADIMAELSDHLLAPDGGVPSRVRVLAPAAVKGLEFDLVVVVDPDGFGDGVTGAVDRYVAMTRATQRLVVLTSS